MHGFHRLRDSLQRSNRHRVLLQHMETADKMVWFLFAELPEPGHRALMLTPDKTLFSFPIQECGSLPANAVRQEHRCWPCIPGFQNLP